MLSTVVDQAGHKSQVKSKYVIGADGGRSMVRQLAGIAFEGEGTNRRWVRIDGIVETDMPQARFGLSSIQSPTHGSVMFLCLDHGATRIGFRLPENLCETAYAMTQEDIIQEAQRALKPFTLKFNTVDWWTIYSIGQRLAANYRSREHILLAGDAAHTHSNSHAQRTEFSLNVS